MKIYKIENIITGDCYIGSETIDKTRFKTHISLLRNNKHHSKYFQRAFKKYGEENFKFIILEDNIIDNIELLKREQFYINILNPKYNVCKIAGNTKGFKHSFETKEKLRLISKELFLIRDNCDFSMKGRKHSEETKKKMQLSSIGRKKTLDTKNKLSKSITKFKVIIYDKISLEQKIVFNSAKECGDYLGISKFKIRDICYGKYGIYKDYIIRFHIHKPITVI